MNDLIRVEVNENNEPVISGRELHDFLGVESKYQDWVKRMIDYGFTENIDYVLINEPTQKKEGSRVVTRLLENHVIKMDMAKEIAMIQRNEKGKQARQYFIEIEKEYNSPEKVMARALLMANEKLTSYESLIEEQKPKVLFADAVSTSHQTILIGELAKLLKQNGVNTGQQRLFSWLRKNGYLIKRKGTDYNAPTQRAMELGLFKVKETVITHSDGHIAVNKTTKVTGKGQSYFVNKFLKEEG